MAWRSVVLGLALILVLLAPMVHVVVESGQACMGGLRLYLYGSINCPYCKRQLELFKQQYLDVTYLCFFEEARECYPKLLEVYKELVDKAGFPSENVYFPLTLVVRVNETGRYVLGIVIGFVDSVEFWNTLSCSEPAENVPVYVGGEARFKLPLRYNEHSSFVENYGVGYKVASETQQPALDPVLAGLIVIVIVVIGLLAYSILSKPRKAKQ